MLAVIAAQLGMLFGFLASGMWVATVAALTGIIGLSIKMGPGALLQVSFLGWSSLNSFIFCSLPLFILLGYLLMESGIAHRIYGSLAPLFDHFSGGLIHTNIVVGTLFAASSGSAIASAAAIGATALPEMESRGYHRGFSAASVVAGGVLSPIIPPSIVMIMYAAITEQSIGRLFIAGIVPGLLLAASFVFYIGVRVKAQPHLAPKGEALAWKPSVRKTVNVWPILVIIAAVLGSIYAGVATPTEAAGVGSAAILILTVAMRAFTWKMLWRSLLSTVKLTSMVLFILWGTKILGLSFNLSGVARYLAEGAVELPIPSVGIMLFIFAVYIILGMLMDGLPMMMMITPIFFPVAMGLGYDPIWFGLVVTILTALGNLTPPVGMGLFVVHGFHPERKFSEIAREAIPFSAIAILVVLLVTAFPQLVMFLPDTMMGR